MAVKIKINWENESVMSESVRIYRADSAFTSNSLPPLLAEVVGDIYEYEDLTTEKDETYFYMLSARLGEQEVFTDCFEVFANKADVPIIVGIDSESVLTPSLSLRSTFLFKKWGLYIYSQHLNNIKSSIFKTCNIVTLWGLFSSINICRVTTKYYQYVSLCLIL